MSGLGSSLAGGAAAQPRQPLQPEFDDIVARSLPLWERGRQGPGRGSAAAALVARRLRRWRRIMGGREALTRRLGGESDATVRHLLAACPPPGRARPAWAALLPAILAASRATESLDMRPCAADRFGAGPAHFPFEEAFDPMLAAARDRLVRDAGSALEVLSAEARKSFERQLLAHLTFVASLTLAEDFSRFRFARAPAFAFERQWLEAPASTHLYASYVAGLRGGWARLFDDRPVLARLLCQSIAQWSFATARLCQRFRADFPRLRTTFEGMPEAPAAAVAGVRCDLSDRHHGGQTVAELILAGGGRLVYKPRTLRPELVFNRFLELLGTPDECPALRTLAIVDRKDYGWSEAAAPTPCAAQEAVARFYVQSGMLLAVLHLLAAVDIHCENVIAAGEHPVVVDLETLLTPSPEGDDGALGSVLATGMLPRTAGSGSDYHADMSALTAEATRHTGIERRAWVRLNTDQMHLSEQPAVGAPMTHRPMLNGETADVRRHLPALLAGFRRMYAHLLASRDRLLGQEAGLAMFDRLELRVLIRGTTTYTNLQLRLLHPEFMADGIERSLELEWLARPLSGPQSEKTDRGLLYRRERDAMEALDVPHFTNAFAAEGAVQRRDPELGFLYAVRDSSVVRRRLSMLGEEDCARQVEAITAALRGRFGIAP